MIQEISSHIVKLLSAHRQNVASAESCTGGLLAKYLSDAPGSSEIFSGGIVAYTEEAKINLLGVRVRAIKTYSVVSEEVAAAMAIGAKRNFATDWALSTTGYSGPTGGTLNSPVGTICLGISGPFGTQTRKYILKNLSRSEHQKKSCEILLALFLNILKKS
jgi:PncC family amidohydrolase